MIDIAFDIDIPSVIHIRSTASYSLGCEIDTFFDTTFQITMYLKQHAGKLIYCIFVRTYFVPDF